MRAILLILVVIIIAVIARMAYYMVPLSGALTELEPKLVETCSRVDVFPGTEDVDIDRETGTVYVSAADRRSPEPPRGGIYAFSLAEGTPMPKRVSTDAPADFQPHGISLYTGADGAKRLFVINHPVAGGNTVEVFDVTADGLTHAETVAYDALRSPNDLVAVGPESFYASNDSYYENGTFMGTLEAYLALPLGSISYWDGTEGKLVNGRLSYGNGVTVSADGETLYASEFLARKVHAYHRDTETGELEAIKSYAVDTGPDNLDMGPDGNVWIGGHSAIFDFLAHAQDPANAAPSHIIKLNPVTGETEDVLIDVDGTISASSVGAVYDGRLVVGAVFDGHVLVCPLP